MFTLDQFFVIARDLIEDSAERNPEYARGIVELIACSLPGRASDGGDAARAYVNAALGVNV